MKAILTLITLCVLNFQLQAQVSFTLSSSPGVGSVPEFVMAADVNGDGKMDLISANLYDTTLSVLTNNGSGGFVLASSPSVGSGPRWVTAADVNGDGKMDLISADYGSGGGNTLSVLTNNGSGGFVLASSPELTSVSYSVVAVDVNGDGKVDLISANADNTLSVLTNSGGGSFVLASSPNLGGNPRSVTAFTNVDGKVDLVSANQYNNTLSVMTNNGSGGFVLAALLAGGNQPLEVAAADVNGDGKVDLISANYADNTLTVWTNNGSGGFVLASSPAVGGQPFVVAAADVNEDGKVDLISANYTDSTLTVLTNDGNGGFVLATTLGVGNNPLCVTAADVNGDGKVDLISANSGNNTLTVLLNTTPFPPASVVPVISSVSPTAGTNGAPVTISGNNFSATASANIVYFGAVRATVLSASLTNLMVAVPAGATFAPITVTVNGLVAYSNAAFEPTFAGSGAAMNTSTFAPGVNMNVSSPITTVIADLDGDGKPDLVTANVYANSISIYQNIGSNGVLNAASFAAPVVYPVGSGSDDPIGVTVADVDGDGKPDLLVADRNNNRIVVYRNISSGGTLTTNSFAPPVFLTVAGDPRQVVVRDLDGDGRPDIVSANVSGSLSILCNIGAAGSITTNSFAPRVDLALAGSSESVAVGDLDGDGKPDLAAADSSGFISLYRNNCTPGNISAGTFDARADLPAQSFSLNVVIGDLDGDGKPELITSAYLPQTMSVYRNISSPGSLTTNSFAASVDYALAGRGHTIALSDINGDGQPDIAEVTELSSALSLFQNIGKGSFTNTSLAARVDFAAGWNAWGVAVGDLDGDGRPDVVFGNVYDNTLTLYKNIIPFGTLHAQCVSAPPGLVSWWPGEGNANDIVGGNNGSPVGALGYTNGVVGQAFIFDGSTSYIPLPASPSLDIGATGSGVTIECWINPNYPEGGAMPIVEWDSATTAGLHLWAEGGHKLYANIIDTSGNSHQLLSANDLLNTTSWQHIAVTYDKSSGAAVLYYNGTVVVTNNFGSITPQTTYPMNIGRRMAAITGQNDTYNGLLDELSLYNRALSASQIQAIYTAGNGGKCFTPVRSSQATGTATLAYGFVVNVSVNDGGFGYTNTPLVRLIGGGGSGAVAYAVVSNGVVTSITVINAGSGYTNAPIVVIDPPFILNPVLGIAPMSFLSFSNLTLGGSYQLQQAVLWYWTNQPISFTATNSIYTQIIAGMVGSGDYRLALNPVPNQAFATAQVVNGFVVGATLTSGGSGYVTSPAVSIVGGDGTNATAVSHISGGVVTGISITSAGIGYTNDPTIQIAQPPAAAVSPTVLPMMRVDSASLAPYHNYQIQFKPDLSAAWGNGNGEIFSATDVTNSQYIFITNGIGFFRLQYVP